jgi:hypothetical protein
MVGWSGFLSVMIFGDDVLIFYFYFKKMSQKNHAQTRENSAKTRELMRFVD